MGESVDWRCFRPLSLLPDGHQPFLTGWPLFLAKQGPTRRYDEVDSIIEGTLDILIDGRKVTATKGDILFIPQNSSITFSTPDAARFMFVTYPADWSNQ